MNYQQTLDFLYSQLPVYHRIGATAYKSDLDNTIALCNALGNPQNDFRSVHVAGTNGKGSVSNMLASILQEQGYKTGLYTSPHLKDFRERIRINGKMIPKGTITRFVSKYRKSIASIEPSFFEMTVGMAFEYFRDKKVDIAVIETGLGGRLDSTNIIQPLLSVITNISFDHMQLLGDTLEKIAYEKAGIIKTGVPVVVGETQEQIKDIFVTRSRETGSELLFADSIYEVKKAETSLSDSDLLCMTVRHNENLYFPELSSPLAGFYQVKNITTLLGVCEMLNKYGIEIRKGYIRKGIEHVLENTGLAGRWQVLSRTPLTICDTGHNEAGIREVLNQIRQTPHDKLHFVFGVVNDKAIVKILELLPRDATYYFCKADIPRGLNADELKKTAGKAGLAGNSYPTVKSALEAARRNAMKNDLVFIGGSTFVVAEAV